MDEVGLFDLFAKIQVDIMNTFTNYVKVEGIKAKDSEYGIPYRLFRLQFQLTAEGERDPDHLAVLRGAVKGALAAWVERGSGPVFVYRNKPTVDMHGSDAVVRFRAHFLSQEAYDAGPVKPVENSA